MYRLLGTVLTWLFFWGSTVAIVAFDDRRAKALAKQRGTVDFAERRIGAYLVAAFFLGAPVLVLYFWATRKKASGALLGIGVLLASLICTFAVSRALSFVAVRLDHAAVARACAAIVPGTDGDECANDAFGFPDKSALLETGCLAGGVTPCLNRDDGESLDLLGLGDPPKPSSWWERARLLCARRPSTVARGRCEVFDVHHERH